MPIAAAIDDRRRATTAAPARGATAMVSRVDPPVVTHVLDDEHTFVRRQRKSAPKREGAVLALRENGPHAEGAPTS